MPLVYRNINDMNSAMALGYYYQYYASRLRPMVRGIYALIVRLQ